MKTICSFRVPGTNNLVAHHHIPEEKSSNYTAVKTAQLACKYIYIYIFIYSGFLIYIGVCIKNWDYKYNIDEEIFPDKNVIQVFYNKK
jgi:hypothetical protein